MELLICRNTCDLEFAQHGKNKSECTHYKNGNCGLDGQLCHVDTYVKKEPSHISIVIGYLQERKKAWIDRQAGYIAEEKNLKKSDKDYAI